MRREVSRRSVGGDDNAHPGRAKREPGSISPRTRESSDTWVPGLATSWLPRDAAAVLAEVPAMTPGEFTKSVSGATPPRDLAPPLQALWWAAKGDWDKAH